MAKRTLGWRCWFDDGHECAGKNFEDWAKLAAQRPEKCLVKMIYYDDGTNQIQTSDWWYEVPHAKGAIRATCTDRQKAAIEDAAPDAVFIRGFWTVDDWFAEIRERALASVW